MMKSFSVAFLLVAVLLLNSVSAAPNASCVFQFRIASKNEDDSAKWPRPPLTLADLYNTLLPASAFPTLNATRLFRQFDDITFNITVVASRNSPSGGGGDGNETTTTAAPTTVAVDPYAGCQAMMSNLSPELKKKYMVQAAWIGFKPAHVPAYMRHITPQPKTLYTALGITGAVLVAVQIFYGVFHSWKNKGTLESVSND